ncbi:MAG TPA: hypothetical protein VFA74_16445 [Terriglobales bacterium]|nr:hypothetical protein [Terriglobales bacterium]
MITLYVPTSTKKIGLEWSIMVQGRKKGVITRRTRTGKATAKLTRYVDLKNLNGICVFVELLNKGELFNYGRKKRVA